MFDQATRPDVAVLTAGRDRPYALGLAFVLASEGVAFDFISSDELESPALRRYATVRVLNLRGDMSPGASTFRKMRRIAAYYRRLLCYAVTSRARVFHVLWNNRLEYFDRTVLLTLYKVLGKRVVFTVHNVNIRQRDGQDTFLNRATLRYQYWLVDHLFVHTRRMAGELHDSFGVPLGKVSVIPFGINDTVRVTSLTSGDARAQLSIMESEKVLLFFGNIAEYKGLHHLVEAMPAILERIPEARLIIAGRPKGAETYWQGVDRRIDDLGIRSRVTLHIEYVPDDCTEIYFKAADLLVLPYTFVFQSGVLFLGYSFGLPVVATRVGSLDEEVVAGETGFMCAPGSSVALADTIVRYFNSPLFEDLPLRRTTIRDFASRRYSWSTVAGITRGVYERLQSI
ncbi:MAG: glycosyltransferase family 4 protein [Burkholderiales bacterium]|nr:glycosyltransferase family 4 protein [Burkholderiales bacterium]